MLRERDLGGAELLLVPEVRLEGELLPARSARAGPCAGSTRSRPTRQARADLIRRTLRGAVASLPGRTAAIERAAAEQLAVAAELIADVDAAYATALRKVEEALRSGSLLRGEVLARWHEVVGTGEFMRGLETRVGRVRDRIKSLATGRSSGPEELEAAVENRVEAVILAGAERAAERAARGWRDRVPGRPSWRTARRSTARPSGSGSRRRTEVRAWQGFVFDLVRSEGASKRTTARLRPSASTGQA